MNDYCNHQTLEISKPKSFPPKYYRHLLKQGFVLSRGIKGAYWGGLILSIGIPTTIGLLTQLSGLGEIAAFSIISQIVQYALQTLLSTGLLMMMINHLRGEKIEAFSVFRYHKNWLKIFGASLMVLLMVLLGLLLLIIPGIYLLYAYSFTLPLMLERNIGIGEAMKLSRRMLKGHWFLVFNWSMLISLFFFFGTLLLAIPLIWIMPALAMGHAMLYLDFVSIKLGEQSPQCRPPL